MGDAVLNALREALYLTLLCAAPPLAAATATGLVMSLAQASMRVEERTLQTVPRLVAALLALAVAGPWIGAELTRFTASVLAALPAFARP